MLCALPFQTELDGCVLHLAGQGVLKIKGGQRQWFVEGGAEVIFGDAVGAVQGES